MPRRYHTYGRLGERIVLLVWTPAAKGIRVISLRSCHDNESRRIAPASDDPWDDEDTPE